MPQIANETEKKIKAKCRSVEGLKSCADCIKQHSECAWCADLRTNISKRCDLKTEFTTSGLCAKQQIYSPLTELKVAPQHNLPLDGRRPDSITPIQLEPQQVEIRMKPGDIVEVPFHYLHKSPASQYEIKDFTIQTSEFQSLGLQIEFSIECHGERKISRICPGINVDEKISFYAKVTLKDCSNKNLIAVSVGIYGYNTVSAIFVTPLCGCDCENPRYQEKRSPRCGYQGNLVCGQCMCDKGKAGERCECDLNHYGVSSADDLINQCRESSDSEVCSGKGKCSCGRCNCDADYIRGRYCECDSGNCPFNVEGRMCSGRGECRCGKCACENGFEGDDCSCTNDNTRCIENGLTCSGNGFCECGKCSCNSDWTGATCNINKKETETSTSLTSSENEDNEDEMKNSEENDLDAGDVLPVQDETKSGENESVPDSATTHQFTMLINSIFFLNTIISFAFCFKFIV